MKRWIVAMAAMVLAMLVSLLVAASRSASAPPQATSPFTPPIEVGKTYGFGVSGSDLTGKVLAEPRGSWVKVEVRDSGKVQAVWLNLLQVSYILPDPPADKGCGGCQGRSNFELTQCGSRTSRCSSGAGITAFQGMASLQPAPLLNLVVRWLGGSLMAWFTEFWVDDEIEPHMICFFITLNYRLPDRSMLGIEQAAAWCEGCRSFGSAEVIPSIEDLNARVQELQTPTQKLLFIYRSQEAIKGAIDELQTRLRWRAGRKSPARCLACGSTAITPVRFGEDRTCVVNGKRLTESAQGFADTADWIAEYTSEGIATSGPTSQRTSHCT